MEVKLPMLSILNVNLFEFMTWQGKLLTSYVETTYNSKKRDWSVIL